MYFVIVSLSNHDRIPAWKLASAILAGIISPSRISTLNFIKKSPHRRPKPVPAAVFAPGWLSAMSVFITSAPVICAKKI